MDAEKKERILRAATRAFGQFGFKKTSIDEIAREAGVAKGTVYLAAKTKEDLFYQTVYREIREWSAEVSRLIDPRLPADELLSQAAFAGVEHMTKRPLVRGLLFGEYSELLPEWASRLEALRALGRANILEILRLGVSQGRFRKDLDLEEVATVMQDLAVSTYLFLPRGPDAAERMRARMAVCAELVRGGMLSAKGQVRVKHEAAPSGRNAK